MERAIVPQTAVHLNIFWILVVFGDILTVLHHPLIGDCISFNIYSRIIHLSLEPPHFVKKSRSVRSEIGH